MLISHEVPDKNWYQQTEIVFVPQKGGLCQELQHHFYSINIAQNSLVCSNRSGREQKTPRKIHTLHVTIGAGVCGL